jgi:hypothetical protein
MDEKIDLVFKTLRMTLDDNEGVIVEPLDVDNGVLRVRYFEGTNEECPECVMAPDAFKQMAEAMIKVQAPYVKEVQVLPAN